MTNDTTKQEKAIAKMKAFKLERQAATANERSKTGPKGAELLRDANEQRLKAGLIHGPLIGRD